MKMRERDWPSDEKALLVRLLDDIRMGPWDRARFNMRDYYSVRVSAASQGDMARPVFHKVRRPRRSQAEMAAARAEIEAAPVRQPAVKFKFN